MSEMDNCVELQVTVTTIRQAFKQSTMNPADWVNPEKMVYPNLPRVTYPTPDAEYVSVEFMTANLPNDFSENYVRGDVMMKTEDSQKIKLQVGDKIRLRLIKDG